MSFCSTPVLRVAPRGRDLACGARPLTLLLSVWGMLTAPVLSQAAAGDVAACRSDYRIEAHLDGDTKALTGELWIDWSNASGEAVEDLWFHLYLNAFSNNRSTHLIESDGKYGDLDAADGWGWSRITTVEVSSASDTTPAYRDVFPSLRYRHPDGGAGAGTGASEDRTVFSVDLPQAVESGESVRIHVRWESQLPRVRRRTGYKDDFLLVAQWFPKLGVYESGRGWNCHEFHRNTEFYADYGTYDVQLDLPLEYDGKVSASGVNYRSEIHGNRLKVSFSAPGSVDRERRGSGGKLPLVHDFTWAADPRFVVDHRTFRFKDWAERFPQEVEHVRSALGPDEELQLRDVDVTLLIQPEHADQTSRHFEATCAALFFYGLWFGEYPYQHITVVDPAWGARGASGMEYPTLFTCGTRLFTTEDMQQPEGVTVHECGHQFWYGLVGNNEFEHAWMDEGFNSFTDSEVMWRLRGMRRETTTFARLPFSGRAVAGEPGGPGLADILVGKLIELPFPFLDSIELEPLPSSGFLDLWHAQPSLTFVPEWTDPRWQDRAGYLQDPASDPVETSGWLYVDRLSYRTNSYPRPAVALRTLAGVVGPNAFLRGMRHYAKEWRYRHPEPSDFYAAFEEGAGVSVDWYFKELFQSTGTVDWSVDVSQAERSEPAGFFQSEGGEFRERQEPEGEQPEAPWIVEVVLEKSGELSLDLPVVLTFEDGHREELLWTRAQQQAKSWLHITREHPTKLGSVVLDPKRAYFIDTDMSNNQWYAEVDDLTAWRWGERVLAQYQRYFHWIGGFGG